ncbi:hypothetical protein POM88_017190 [Heracleum sosnowskyi]|uniref:Uncharacterized protein n=1 Tax=Heracleum sosnowskyi TaxID=360622 RepID=A0AAD8MY41_9APIA|nr:hypothetical protein POM88_017190 [Heracleum sosnowskyi]
MFKYGSPMPNSSSGSSVGSDLKNCHCGQPGRIFMSWPLRNPGRRFLTCYKPEWYDNDFTGRTKDVVVHLNNRRIVLEEKLSLVEERLAMEVEKKLAVEAHNKKLGRTVKFFSYVMVVLRRHSATTWLATANSDRAVANPSQLLSTRRPRVSDEDSDHMPSLLSATVFCYQSVVIV